MNVTFVEVRVLYFVLYTLCWMSSVRFCVVCGMVFGFNNTWVVERVTMSVRRNRCVLVVLGFVCVRCCHIGIVCEARWVR